MFKKKIKIDKTTIKFRGVPEGGSAFHGVMLARERLGGKFPEHVLEITISDDMQIDDPINEPDIHTRGICSRRDGKSRIRLNLGSIARTLDLGNTLAEGVAHTTLHEIRHSQHENEKHNGLWWDRDLNLVQEEYQAENYAHSKKRRL